MLEPEKRDPRAPGDRANVSLLRLFPAGRAALVREGEPQRAAGSGSDEEYGDAKRSTPLMTRLSRRWEE